MLYLFLYVEEYLEEQPPESRLCVNNIGRKALREKADLFFKWDATLLNFLNCLLIPFEGGMGVEL